jgi:tetratricopeptide (TPR) repeat protein
MSDAIRVVDGALPTRLSQSPLWDMQRRYFERAGVAAWRDGVVPHFVTSNTYVARSYARVLEAFLVDCDGPATIVELGAGSGRLAYAILLELAESGLRFRYLLTDVVAANVEHARGHPRFRPFVDAGQLDFAVFDLESDDLPVRGPVAVLANYVLDGVPIDACQVEGGELFEARVLVSGDSLEDAELTYEIAPAAPDYYDDAELDGLLAEYRELPSTAVRFPIAALRFLQRARAHGDGTLFLSADKGWVHADALLHRSLPSMAVHGSFSMAVNYHALARFTARAGGEALFASTSHNSLLVSAFLFDLPNHRLTRRAFRSAVEQFGPDDFYQLKKAVDAQGELLSLDALVAFLRLSGPDPEVLRRRVPGLIERVEDASHEQLRALRRLIDQAWQAYLPLGEDRDLAFAIGTLLFRMDFVTEALVFFGRSVALHGPDPQTLYNHAVCYHRLDEDDKALEWAERALEARPEHEGAREIRVLLRSKARRS